MDPSIKPGLKALLKRKSFQSKVWNMSVGQEEDFVSEETWWWLILREGRANRKLGKREFLKSKDNTNGKGTVGRRLSCEDKVLKESWYNERCSVGVSCARTWFS